MNYCIKKIDQTELIENEPCEKFAFQERFISINKYIQQKSIPKAPKAGYGSCRACDCRGYISKHNGSHECKTCGHHYDRHN